MSPAGTISAREAGAPGGVLSLPMDPTISDRQVLRVIAAVHSACVSLGEPSSKAA